jgi:hypothetical protein
MTIVQIANDLLVATVVLPTSGFIIGFECSQPVSMQATSIARVAGVVQSFSGDAFGLRAVIDGSNDLSTWVAVHTTADLIGSDQAPFKFKFVPTATLFPYAFARVRWILEPTEAAALVAGQRVVLSANLTTGLR